MWEDYSTITTWRLCSNEKEEKIIKIAKKLYDKQKLYDAEEAVDLVLQSAKAKFDETIEISARLGVDPRHADQQVRGTVVLPNGTGKKYAYWLSQRRSS